MLISHSKNIYMSLYAFLVHIHMSCLFLYVVCLFYVMFFNTFKKADFMKKKKKKTMPCFANIAIFNKESLNLSLSLSVVIKWCTHYNEKRTITTKQTHTHTYTRTHTHKHTHIQTHIHTHTHTHTHTCAHTHTHIHRKREVITRAGSSRPDR